MRSLRIGWMIRAGGIFGSVREAIEVGNALMRRGHEFTMYTDEGKDLRWLPNTLRWAHTPSAAREELDVLFWSDSPDEPYYTVFKASPARLKSFCMMGFDASQAEDLFVRGRHAELLRDHWTIADGEWQLGYISKYSKRPGPPIGGVNLQQFRPIEQPYTADVVWSGDPRERKGGDMVTEAVKGLRVDSYSKKRVRQEDMAAYICRAPIFVDGHKRGGWCNPVMEAMACARAIVCTRTECNSDFVEHGVNALLVDVGDVGTMRMYIDLLHKDPAYVHMLSSGAYRTAARYGYDHRAEALEAAILDRLA